MSADPQDVADRYRRHLNAGHAMVMSVVTGEVEAAADGVTVTDGSGATYLDCGGHGVFLLGHRHPKVVAAVKRALDTQPLSTRFLLNPLVAQAAEALATRTPEGLEHVYFGSTGAETAEIALKLMRLAGRHHVVTMEGGFHGKTMGALSLTSRESFVEPFLPLLPGVVRVPFGDAAAVEREVAAHPGAACVLLEPVQGEGGVRLPPPGYLAAVERACREHGALLVLDEVQSGLGRVGRWWGADLEDVRPDVLLAGKILGGGVLPVSAVVATDEVFAPLDRDPYLHSSTFGNSPVLAAAALATLGVLEEEDLVARSATLGARLLDGLRAVAAEHGAGLVTEVRGIGLLLGVECVDAPAAGELAFELVGRGVLPSYALTSATTMRLTPPALLTDAHVEQLLDAFAGALTSTREAIGAA